MNRDDFEMLKTELIYFDNNATTLKPKEVVKAIDEYYMTYTANAHRGDYKNSLKVDMLYEDTRELIRNYLNADSSKEIIFTSGATDSLNLIAFGFGKKVLKKGDEVLISKTEHASLVLPWLRLEKEIGIKVKYIPLYSNLKLTLDNLKKSVTKKTKVVALAHVTNTIGDVRDILNIGKFLKEENIYFVVDAAQSIGHRKIDVKECNIDFLAFSGHKMLGPTGIGVMYGRYDLLEEMDPVRFGGGMNSYFKSNGRVKYQKPPSKFEAGTPNIAGVIGLRSAFKYLERVGRENIRKHEEELKDYLLLRLKEIDNITVINKNAESSNILFNINGVEPQDTALYLDHYNICVRAGNHCAKLLQDELGISNTCRISLYLYNTKEEIDKLVKVLKNSKHIFDEAN